VVALARDDLSLVAYPIPIRVIPILLLCIAFALHSTRTTTYKLPSFLPRKTLTDPTQLDLTSPRPGPGLVLLFNISTVDAAQSSIEPRFCSPFYFYTGFATCPVSLWSAACHFVYTSYIPKILDSHKNYTE